MLEVVGAAPGKLFVVNPKAASALLRRVEHLDALGNHVLTDAIARDESYTIVPHEFWRPISAYRSIPGPALSASCWPGSRSVTTPEGGWPIAGARRARSDLSCLPVASQACSCCR